VTAVAVTAPASTVAAGATLQLAATARNAAGAAVTGAFTWSSSSNAIATVSAGGLVTGVVPGVVTVTALESSGVAGTVNLTVTVPPVASVTVSPAGTSLLVGGTQQLQAVPRDASGTLIAASDVQWSSGNPAVAAVSATGLVTAMAPGGPVTITATSGAASGTAQVTVSAVPVASVAITPAGPHNLRIGQSLDLDVVARDAAGNPLARPVAWSSSNPAVAGIDPANGVVTGVGVGGPVTITATVEGRAATASVTVTQIPVAGVAINPPGPHNLFVGASLDLDAMAVDAGGNPLPGRGVAWASNNPTVASVNPSNGVVTGFAPGGPVTITAAVEGWRATVTVTVSLVPIASITVTAGSAVVMEGSTLPLTATARDADGNTLPGRDLAWSTTNASVATVSSTGVVTGVAAGAVTITASGEGRSGSVQLAVQARTATTAEVLPRLVVLDAGASTNMQTLARDFTGRLIPDPVVTWSSSATGVATITPGTGDGATLRGVAPGTAAIRGQVDAAVDTGWVAVLAPTSLFASAFPGTSPKATAAPGQFITVPVILDLTRVSATGDLGSVQLDLAYDPAVLIYNTTTVLVSGSVNHNVPTPGTYKFAMAHGQPQGTGRLTLANISFRVAPNAPVGAVRALNLTFTAVPTNTNLQPYSIPVTLHGRVRVVAPQAASSRSR
jgi:uncharacterized protein YjdB